MKFCNKCGNLMITEKKDEKLVYVCRKCKNVEKSTDATTISEKMKGKKEVVTVFDEEKELEQYPIDKDAKCPECGKKGAHWFLRQTRAADEPPTIFYCCAHCKHKWREY
ncbi:MAG: transcription factor S [Candidatus Aenigmarchaeota archaeon]|nr:transcription factor S [Candidatus Aenigmarchaeota archaeon]